MKKNLPEPVIREIAKKDHLGFRYYSFYDTPAQLLRSEGASSRYFRDIYDLYRDMEDKDAHLFAVLQTRKNGVLSRPRKISAASDDERDLKVAAFVRNEIAKLNDFDAALFSLLDAIGKGFSIIEILWEYNDGKVGIKSLKFRPQGRFYLGDSENPRLLTSSFPLKASPSSIPPSSPLPSRKFMLFTFGSACTGTQGKGLLMKAYWYYWFKKNNLKFWVMFNEKFGSPTVVGKYRLGAGEEERRRLFEVVESLQNDTGVTIPENVAIEFLEAKRSGTINTYRDLADWCNDELSKLVLGATLTTGEGRRSGSMALGKVHDRVRCEYIEADARALMSVINGQLIRWLVDFNFGKNVPAPRFEIDTTEDDGLERDIKVDQDLVRMGVPLPLSYFYSKYKRPAPIDDERSLHFDDSNLYQYHIQFGVLTINEVRATLGLDPVPWGDSPPSSNLQNSSGAGEENTREELGRQAGIEKGKEK
jgi:phage gp29-like protein